MQFPTSNTDFGQLALLWKVIFHMAKKLHSLPDYPRPIFSLLPVGFSQGRRGTAHA